MNPDKDIFLQPLGSGNSMLAAFEGKLVDGFAFNPPWPEEEVAKGLGQIVINPFIGEAKELQGGTFLVLASSRATLASKAPALQAMVRALTRAIKLANDDPEQARKILRNHFPHIDLGVFNASFDKAIKGIPKTPVISPAQFAATITTINITSKPPLTVSYSQTVAPELAERAAAELLAK
jgi:NitT/TauT family transport system substrate-binding protein